MALKRTYRVNDGHILSELSAFRKSSTLTDVSLIAFGKELQAHRCVLASNSAYFKTLFCGEFTDSNQRALDLSSHVSDAKHVETLLNFLYGKDIEITPENFVELTHLASYLDIKLLASFCIDFVRKTLSVHNCIQYFVNWSACPMTACMDCTIAEELLGLLQSRFHDFFITNEQLRHIPGDSLLYLAFKDVAKYCTLDQILHFLNTWVKLNPGDLCVVAAFLESSGDPLLLRHSDCRSSLQVLCSSVNKLAESDDKNAVLEKIEGMRTELIASISKVSPDPGQVENVKEVVEKLLGSECTGLADTIGIANLEDSSSSACGVLTDPVDKKEDTGLASKQFNKIERSAGTEEEIDLMKGSSDSSGELGACNHDWEEVLVVLAPSAEVMNAHQERIHEYCCDCATIKKPIYSIYVYRPSTQQWLAHSQLNNNRFTLENLVTCFNQQFYPPAIKTVKGLFEDKLFLGTSTTTGFDNLLDRRVRRMTLLSLDLKRKDDSFGIQEIKTTVLDAEDEYDQGHVTVVSYRNELYLCVQCLCPDLHLSLHKYEKGWDAFWQREKYNWQEVFSTPKISLQNPLEDKIDYAIAVSEKTGDLLILLLVNDSLVLTCQTNLNVPDPTPQEVTMPFKECTITKVILLEEADNSGFVILCTGEFLDDEDVWLGNQVFHYNFSSKKIILQDKYFIDEDKFLGMGDCELERRQVLVNTTGKDCKYWCIQTTSTGRSKLMEVDVIDGGKEVQSKMLTPPPLPAAYFRYTADMLKEFYRYKRIILKPSTGQIVKMSRNVLEACKPVSHYPY